MSLNGNRPAVDGVASEAPIDALEVARAGVMAEDITSEQQVAAAVDALIGSGEYAQKPLA